MNNLIRISKNINKKNSYNDVLELQRILKEEVPCTLNIDLQNISKKMSDFILKELYQYRSKIEINFIIKLKSFCDKDLETISDFFIDGFVISVSIADNSIIKEDLKNIFKIHFFVTKKLCLNVKDIEEDVLKEIFLIPKIKID